MNRFLSLFQWFPYVLASVVAVEQAVTTSIPGTAKKTIILNSLTAVAAVGEQVPETTVSEVSALINSVVTELNDAGVFTHKAAAVAAPVL